MPICDLTIGKYQKFQHTCQWKRCGASRRGNESGAAQAARCLECAAEFPRNEETIGPHNAVVLVWYEDRGDFSPGYRAARATPLRSPCRLRGYT